MNKMRLVFAALLAVVVATTIAPAELKVVNDVEVGKDPNGLAFRP